MKKETLKKIVELTEKNCHTEARLVIADYFEYLANYREIFQCIKRIHAIEGSLSWDLANYREDVTKRMLQKIREIEGEAVCFSMANSL